MIKFSNLTDILWELPAIGRCYTYRGVDPDEREYLYRIKWKYGSYDGPASGICEWRGKDYWFERIRQSDGFSGRMHVLVDLPPELMDQMRERQRIQEEMGYKHSSYDEEGKPGPYVHMEHSEWAALLNRIDEACKHLPRINDGLLNNLPIVAYAID